MCSRRDGYSRLVSVEASADVDATGRRAESVPDGRVDDGSAGDSVDAPRKHHRRKLIGPAAFVVLAPLVMYLVMKPDWFYIENGVDPFFYTAYVQNFSAALHAGGLRHYFVSRWSIYLPQRVLLTITGDPKLAHLTFRWVAVSAIIGAVLVFGRRIWRPFDAAAIAILVVLMPMTIRAMFDNYAGSVVLPCGIVFLVAFAVWPSNGTAVAVAGVSLGLMIVANPFSICIAAAAAPFWLRRLDRRRIVALTSIAVAGVLAVVLGGLLLFRVRYGVSNIYQPTFEYIRDHGSERGSLNSPRLLWLAYRLWLYIPLIVLGTYVVLVRSYSIKFGALQRFIMHACALQYAFQVVYELGFNSGSLQLPYYWMYVLPATLLAFGVVTGALAQLINRWILPIVVCIVVALVPIIGSPLPEMFSSWWVALAVVVCLAYLGLFRLRAHRWIAPITMVAVVLALQFGSPRPEPTLPGEYPVAASYERAYDGDGSIGVDSFKSVTWFVRQMKSLPAPVVGSASFWFNEPNGSRMAAMYIAHVSGNWVDPDWSVIRTARSEAAFYDRSAIDLTPTAGLALSAPLIEGLIGESIPTLVILGSRADVDAVSSMVLAAAPTYRTVLTGVSPNRARTSIRVLTIVPG